MGRLEHMAIWKRQCAFVMVEKILYVEAFGHHVKIHTATGEIESRETLAKTAELLAGTGLFARCHQSYLVNVEHVVSLLSKSVTLSSGKTLVVSRKYKEGFLEVCKNRLNKIS